MTVHSTHGVHYCAGCMNGKVPQLQVVRLTFDIEIGASRDYGFSWAWDADSLSLLDAEMCYIGETAGTSTDGGCATQYSNRESWRSNRSRLLEGAALIHQRTRSEGWQIVCRSRLNGRSVVDRF